MYDKLNASLAEGWSCKGRTAGLLEAGPVEEFRIEEILDCKSSYIEIKAESSNPHLLCIRTSLSRTGVSLADKWY